MPKLKLIALQLWEAVLYVILLLAVSLNIYWYFEEDSYYVETKEKEVQEIRRGGLIEFQRWVCPVKNNVKISVTTRVVFSDGYSLRVDGYEFPPVSKCGYYGFKKFMPYRIGVGDYMYSTTIEYSVNPLKSVTKVLAPIRFRVLEGSDNG